MRDIRAEGSVIVPEHLVEDVREIRSGGHVIIYPDDATLEEIVALYDAIDGDELA